MNIFISANNTGKGKTHSTLLLMEYLAQKGYKIGVMKPIETGVENFPQDGLKLFEKAKELNPLLNALTIDDIVPVQHTLPAAPIVSGKVDFDKIKKAYDKINPLCDILLIEGAGGVLVPVTDSFKMIDFLSFFNAKLLLVIGSNLGMINDFLLNKHYLETTNINYTYAVNLFDENEYFKISHPFMKRYDPLFIQKDLDKITQQLLKKN
ncbi:dethiobiotin synthase [Nautilia sp. PV-1]|uniref:dethiobiotin synthase n=1 Tax=Nautilia sp. PV-1 TaxID=2579250 RepID=UPI000FDC27CF|nr:dethiobiotin synthase [Nautilia sp. PV-1]AZV47230.1 dethiobiotin synthase [Nautilia sp. PV-1]